MADKHPTQGIPDDGRKGSADGTNRPGAAGRGGTGDSGGRPYPNPHTGKSDKAREQDFGRHGGQTTMGYHGPLQLGDDKVEPDANPNAVSRSS